MPRILCSSFTRDFPEIHEASIRFRKPFEDSKERCRLWMSDEKTRVRWIDYQKVEVMKSEVAGKVDIIIKCPSIWDKWECEHGGWCAQLWYGDVIVSKKDS